MDPGGGSRAQHRAAAPRARGDGPAAYYAKEVADLCSPRTRGWTHCWRRESPSLVLLPAHAGMDPLTHVSAAELAAAPRARGDGPGARAAASVPSICSPRTRGWTQREPLRRPQPALLPAHAGMDPCPTPDTGTGRSAPRARGDGPQVIWSTMVSVCCSPRTRGWTSMSVGLFTESGLLPAHAGMDPLPVQWSRRSEPAPRARGDGPAGTHSSRSFRYCSPRTRGWTPDGADSEGAAELLPAHAGMDPQVKGVPAWHGNCSPRTRGWTRDRARRARQKALLPAHAGMDPSRPRRRTRPRSAPRARGDGPEEGAA